MKWFRLKFLLVAGLLLCEVGYCLPPMQLFVELTPTGGTLRPPPGRYSGPVVIERRITLEGGGEVIIDGGGDGTVVRIKADGSIIRGVKIVNSGGSHDQLDSGLLLEANDVLIENNVIENVLFGINLRRAYDNRILGNSISSRGDSASLRGEGLRLWYSSDNLIEKNEIANVRDILIINSPDNRLSGNLIHHNRMGMELVFSPGNEIVGNSISWNRTGIVGIYSDDLLISANRFAHMREITGAALAIKESSQVKIMGNEILHCAIGLTVNSPVHPENILYLEDNHIAYNDVALYFYGEKGGHVIHGNRFDSNLLTVAVSASTSALANDWKGNHWGDYEGFDRNFDGIGDTPHDVYLYSDRIWMERPMIRFFRASPVLELIDFAERLTSFSKPDLIFRDPAPLM
ncbi:MAG: nitrous oxide reductase family maturation protein NosD [Gammaproteobacteria bacterium]|nr:nitrous oxide reductase family maturation protein NosD [Gammaproteobacteria bacterium]